MKPTRGLRRTVWVVERGEREEEEEEEEGYGLGGGERGRGMRLVRGL